MSASETPSPSSGSSFWRFSLRFYRQSEVADACIALQEQAGVDVNLLLFLLWHATQKRALSQADVAQLERRISHPALDRVSIGLAVFLNTFFIMRQISSRGDGLVRPPMPSKILFTFRGYYLHDQ